MTNPRQKGSGFEREVAKIFKDALGIDFVRTPLSGGWGKCQTKGDLVVPPGSTFKWFIECKKDEGWDLWSALFFGAGPINAWWIKAQQQAKSEGKQPALVMAQNFKKPLVMCLESQINFDQKFPHYHYGDGAILIGLDLFLKCISEIER